VKPYFSLAAAASALALAVGAAHADGVVIEHVTLLDGTHAPQTDMTVATDGERIASVTPSALAHGLKGRRIDGRGRYLMPGLMDVHIHLRGGFDPGAAPDAEPGPPNRQEGVEALASFLYAGVTTVLDVGNRPEHILPLRADERAGRILAPRIFATGNLITYPGSHGDRVALRISDFEKDKALLDKHIAEQQPDVLKLTLEEEGWGSRPMIPLMPIDLLAKIIRYYNLHGIRTTVHVSSELRSLEAIYAGSDTLAHPVIQGPVSDSFVRLMAAKKTPFASTLTIGDNYNRLVEHPEYLDQPLYVASFSPAERARLKTRTREEWCRLLEGTDACFAPVLTTDEASLHPHNKVRGTYVEIDGVIQPAPAPRFSRTVPDLPMPPQPNDPEQAETALAAWLEPAEIAALRRSGVFA